MDKMELKKIIATIGLVGVASLAIKGCRIEDGMYNDYPVRAIENFGIQRQVVIGRKDDKYWQLNPSVVASGWYSRRFNEIKFDSNIPSYLDIMKYINPDSLEVIYRTVMDKSKLKL